MAQWLTHNISTEENTVSDAKLAFEKILFSAMEKGDLMNIPPLNKNNECYKFSKTKLYLVEDVRIGWEEFCEEIK